MTGWDSGISRIFTGNWMEENKKKAPALSYGTSIDPGKSYQVDVRIGEVYRPGKGVRVTIRKPCIIFQLD